MIAARGLKPKPFTCLKGALGLGGGPVFSLACDLKGFLETIDLAPTCHFSGKKAVTAPGPGQVSVSFQAAPHRNYFLSFWPRDLGTAASLIPLFPQPPS